MATDPIQENIDMLNDRIKKNEHLVTEKKCDGAGEIVSLFKEQSELEMSRNWLLTLQKIKSKSRLLNPNLNGRN